MVAPFPDRLSGVGTEPFWSLRVDRGEASYATPERPSGTAFAVRRTIAGGALVLAGQLDGRPFTARIAPGPCSDGMSDRVWLWRLDLAIGSEKRSGCAAATA